MWEGVQKLWHYGALRGTPRRRVIGVETVASTLFTLETASLARTR
jgi:hypothetical protein